MDLLKQLCATQHDFDLLSPVMAVKLVDLESLACDHADRGVGVSCATISKIKRELFDVVARGKSEAVWFWSTTTKQRTMPFTSPDKENNVLRPVSDHLTQVHAPTINRIEYTLTANAPPLSSSQHCF
jgi:hypothetical protein